MIRALSTELNEHLEKFEYEYSASVVESPIKYHRIKPATLPEVHSWYCGDMIGDPPMPGVEEVDMVEIMMPLDRLPRLLEAQESFWWNERIRERNLRQEHPVLQQFWDQYQTMLALLR